MLAVGLTGGIGSGKSTVAALLAAHGAAVVDADEIAREVVEPQGPAYAPVVARFGPAVVAVDGSIDRAALAKRAFSDPSALADLNSITHPAIGAVMAARLAELSTGPVAVVLVVIPLLRREHVDALGLRAVVVVDSPTDVAVDRLVTGRGMDPEDVRARVAAQSSRADRLALADYVVDNAGSTGDLESEVDALWRWIEGLGGDVGRGRD